jgi:hypothetical protein
MKHLMFSIFKSYYKNNVYLYIFVRFSCDVKQYDCYENIKLI